MSLLSLQNFMVFYIAELIRQIHFWVISLSYHLKNVKTYGLDKGV
jgi:hypothetical protein